MITGCILKTSYVSSKGFHNLTRRWNSLFNLWVSFGAPAVLFYIFRLYLFSHLFGCLEELEHTDPNLISVISGKPCCIFFFQDCFWLHSYVTYPSQNILEFKLHVFFVWLLFTCYLASFVGLNLQESWITCWLQGVPVPQSN